MLTNPPTSSTSVSSSSLVEVTTLTSPSPSAVTAAVVTTQETTVPAERHSEQGQTPTKIRKKKGTGQRLEPAAAGASGLVPCNPPENHGNGNNGKKRSRKQKIDTLPDSFELTPFLARQSVPEKPGKRRKTASKSSGDNVKDLVSAPGNKRKNVNKNNVNNSRASTGLLRKTKKSTSATTTTSLPDNNSVASYDPKQKIVLKRNEFIDPNLSFTIFPDLSRGLGAIGPSQVIIAVESTREPGTQDELISDSGRGNNSSNKPIEFQCQTLSLFLSVPHFLPLTSVYNSGEPFARILRYSALEQYTKGVLGRNQVSTFRFYGPRYEKQVPTLSATQEKNSQIAQIRKKIPNPNAYLESVLIIKHPILGFYSRKLVNLNFVILKKIYLGDQKNTIIGHLKAKVVQLRRSGDLKNIEIYVDESRVTEAAADVNAMNHQNIQPVIQTPSGLVPVITRTTYQAQQEYQLEEQPQQIVEAQFQYVPYHYQTSTELVQEIASNSGDGNNISNLIFNLDNSTGEYFGGTPTFRDETGARVLILSPGEFQSVQSSSNFVTTNQSHQQIIHHQSEPTSIYTNQEQQPVIIQQHQQFSAAQQLQLQQQQQQAYTIQQNQPQQEQQIIQIQSAEPIKEGQRQIFYIPAIPGTGQPFEIQFEPQVVEPTRVYTQQQQRSEQLQVQVQSQQQQFRSGQQIVVQQHQNQFQVQQQHPQAQALLGSSQNQVAIRQQHLLTQQVNSSGTTAQTFQHRSATQQQQVIVQQAQQQQVIVQQAQQQQPHVHQQQQQQQSVVSSSIQQVHHHQTQLNQIQGIQSSTPQVRFQSPPRSPLRQQTQSLLHTQVQGQSRPQLIQQQVVPALQSPPNSAATSHYHPQRVSLQQQTQVPQHQPPPQFAQTRAPLTSSIPQALSPSKQKGKAKQPKGSQKKNAIDVPTNQAPNNFIADSGLTDYQLEQLRLREQRKPTGYQLPPGLPQLATSQISPIRPGSVTPPYAVPPASSALRPVVSSQQQQQPQLRLITQSSSVVRKSGQSFPRSQRPPAPPPPIISSTTSLARFPSVSSGTTTVGHLVAPKSQIPSASSTTQLTSLPESTAPPPLPTSPGRKQKTFYVVPTVSAPSSPATVATPLKHEFRSKPGHLAVCPHCGVGNRNILRCNRCKHELPADVKFIKDEWEVNKGGAAVAIPAPNTSVPTASTTVTSAITGTTSVNNGKLSTGASASSKTKTAGTGRKILLVNKPQPPVPAVQVSSPVVVNNTIVAPGTVHVQIQPDGGSSVTIGSGVLPGKPVVVTKPAPAKRRAPARKRQLECITLSSDDEEPDSPKPKVAKQEETKPIETTASTLVTSAKFSAANTPAVIEATVTTTTTTTSTNTSNVITKANAGTAANGTTQQVQQGEANKTVNSVKKEEEPTTSSIVTAKAENTTMSKKMKINFSLDKASTSTAPCRAGKTDPSTSPEDVYARMEMEMGTAGSSFEFATFVCRSVRVGSYKVTSTDVGHDMVVHLTELGLKFSLPLANFKRKIMKICIPKESILNMKVHFTKRLQVIFIKTGPKYGSWVRGILGLDGSPTNETSNYYCPLEGKPCQQTITFLGDNLEDSDIGLIKKLYSHSLQEIEYTAANDILMKITPQSYQSSIGLSSNSGEPSPKIISTTSMANVVIPSPPSSILSTASTVIIPRNEYATPTLNSGPGSVVGANSNKDSERVILFYEGRNNIKVPICPNDINCLNYSSFLNDQIIDFWMAVIQTEILSEEDKNRTFVYDSFFYSKLTEKMKRKVEEDGNMTAGERRHSRVKKRTKNVDIFSKDFLIVPINENYHWFIAIICFPGMEGYHDYNTMARLPNYKRPRTITSKGTSSSTKTAENNAKKPVVYNQPKNDSTASYSCRDEAPEDPEENDQISSPDTPGTDGSDSKSQGKTEAGESSTGDNAPPTTGTKRKSEFDNAVKHPCILIFDSLAGEARGRIYSTLREYLRIEYKTKKKSERVFDKTTMPGVMPKVPQQPNFSDCGLFMLQYVESFFSEPIPTFEPKDINLKQWFPPSIAENKRREIYDFIKKKIHEKYPQNFGDIPPVRFEPDENDIYNEEAHYHQHPSEDDDDLDEDEDFEAEEDSSDEEDEDFRQLSRANKSLNRTKQLPPGTKASSDSDDHNYATTPPKPMSTAELAASLPTVLVAISPLPSTSDTTTKKNT